MNTQSISCVKLAAIVSLLFLFPFFSSAAELSGAYATTNQSVTKLNETTVLYTVTYELGFLNADLWLPISAVRGLADNRSGFNVRYGFANTANNIIFPGETSAVVLSSAEIIDGQYYIPRGKREELTLVALLQVPSTEGLVDDELALQITRVPYVILSKGETSSRRIGKTNIDTYRTPSISF